MLKLQSNGLGQQSVTLYLMSSVGVLPRLDYSIFADPKRESRETYEYLRWLVDWQRKHDGVPIVTAGKQSIYTNLIKGVNSSGNRFTSIPAWTKNPDGKVGQLRRQCTYEYKILQFNKAVRKIVNKPTGRLPQAEVWMGITIEELDRMEYPEVKGFKNIYPFTGYSSDSSGHITRSEYLPKHFSRADCVKWLVDNGFPVPPKSSCTFCPFKNDRQWLELKREDPKEWKAVVKLDKAIRNASKAGADNPIYLHRSLKPLDQVELKENQTEIFDRDCKGSYCEL